MLQQTRRKEVEDQEIAKQIEEHAAVLAATPQARQLAEMTAMQDVEVHIRADAEAQEPLKSRSHTEYIGRIRISV